MAQAESTFTLTNKIRKSLTWQRNHDSRLYVQERAAAILKIADGRTPHWVAKNGLLRPRIQIRCTVGSRSSKPKASKVSPPINTVAIADTPYGLGVTNCKTVYGVHLTQVAPPCPNGIRN